MFLEIHKPRVCDHRETKDRIYIRIAEPGAPTRFWANLSFENKEQFRQFVEQLNYELNRDVRELEYNGPNTKSPRYLENT